MYVAEFECGDAELRQILLLFPALVDAATPAAQAWQERLGDATRHVLLAGNVEVTGRLRVADLRPLRTSASSLLRTTGNRLQRELYLTTMSPLPATLEAVARSFLRLNEGAPGLIKLCADRARHDAAEIDLPPVCLRLAREPVERDGCVFVDDFRLRDALAALGTAALAHCSPMAWQSAFRAYRADAEERRSVQRNRIAIDQTARLARPLREHQQAIAQRFSDATLLENECLWVEPAFESAARDLIASVWQHGPGRLGLPACELERVEGSERDVLRCALHPALFDFPSPLIASGMACSITDAITAIAWQPPADWYSAQRTDAVLAGDAAEEFLHRVETRLARLEHELERRQTVSAECIELRKAIAIGHEDPAFALVKARQILEGIVGRLYRIHRPNAQAKTMLFDMIRDLTGQSNRANVLPRHIGNYLDTVRVLGNLEAHRGADGDAKDAVGGLSRNDLELSLMMMLNVIEWFLLEHLPTEVAPRCADA